MGAPETGPAIRGSGGLRDFFEPRFGFDFGRVRIHTDARADRAARSLDARAFTFGRHVAFRAGEYRPGSPEGRRLLAHELTHVLQQEAAPRAGGSRDPSAPAETPHRAAPGIQRALVVERSRDNIPGSTTRERWEDVSEYMAEINSGFTVSPSGPIEPTFDCVGPLNTSSQCLCDLHNSLNPVPWKIDIDDDMGPQTLEAERRVKVHSTNSVFEFRSWGGGADAGTRTTASNARVLAHELCGHAWLMERGVHPRGPVIPTATGQPMARPSHDPTIDIENEVAREMYGPTAQERGTFRADDPHYGESMIRLAVWGWDLNRSAFSDLPPDHQDRLRALRDFMLGPDNLLLKADVIGHADHTGGTGSAINTTISRNRAHSVRDWLIAEGVDAGRFRSVRAANNSECPPAPVNNPSCRGAEVYLFSYEAASESFVNPVPRPTP